VKALIVGGGLGGLAAARALRQAGIQVAVFERATDLSKVQIGGGLQVRSNGMRVMQQLGLADKVQSAGNVIESYEHRTWRGERIGSWPVGETGRAVGAPTVGIRRSELHRILSEAQDPGVLHLGAECTGFRQDAAGVTAHLVDGRTERGDFLVAADGMHSAIRAQLLGPGKPRYAGFVVARAIVEFRHELLPVGMFILWYGPRTSFLAYHVRPGQLYWYECHGAPEGTRDPKGAVKAALLDRVRGFVEPVEAVIEATPEAAIQEVDMVGRDPVDRWGEDRVSLLGDAAHAMPFTQGQGLNQALEDAVVLARCAEAKPDVISALRSYEARRMPRTANVVRGSWRAASLFQRRGPVGHAVAMAAMRLGHKIFWKQQAKLLAHDF
jgi:2-polyprenyl-6-methoxyphenol hydroxylase-like FAD-dependent oxidoreductase